jgi:hypothetical protein
MWDFHNQPAQPRIGKFLETVCGRQEKPPRTGFAYEKSRKG